MHRQLRGAVALSLRVIVPLCQDSLGCAVVTDRPPTSAGSNNRGWCGLDFVPPPHHQETFHILKS